MKKAFVCSAAVLILSIAAAAQIPQQFIWKITFIADSVGNSKISVQNRCKESHDFSISGRNVPYLDFVKTKVSVRGRSSETVPVVVNTASLQRRSYLGEVTLFCLTCAREAGCSQSRDILNVTLNVVTSTELENYKPSKEFGIDAPIAITSSASRSGTGSGGATDAEIKAILVSLSGNPGADTDNRAISACGVPRFRENNPVVGKDCKNCSDKQKRVKELEEKVRRQTLMAEKYCLGLMQLENTTAFVEARASRSRRQLADASTSGADERVLMSLRTEAENSRKDAKVFRDKLESARFIVDEAKAEAFSSMQELDEAANALEECARKNPAVCK